MKKNKVISYKNLPSRLPTIPTLVGYLFLDKFHAPEWVCAVCGTLGAIIWIACIIGKIKENHVDIFEEK